VESSPTPHGEVETPVFMPVRNARLGQRHLERMLEQLKARSSRRITYHLLLAARDGAGPQTCGLHRFMSWRRACSLIPAGSSLQLNELRKVTEEGVELSLRTSTCLIFLSPESATEAQIALGPTHHGFRTNAPEYPADATRARRSMEMPCAGPLARRTILRRIRTKFPGSGATHLSSRTEPAALAQPRSGFNWELEREPGTQPTQALFGSCQGGMILAKKGIGERTVELGFDGYAIRRFECRRARAPPPAGD